MTEIMHLIVFISGFHCDMAQIQQPIL
jgi:hypothetical protein